MLTQLAVGDTVAYTDSFLDRQSRYHHHMESAQGKVTALHRLQTGIILADIDWNKPALPKRVNAKYLITKKTASPARRPG